MICLFLFSFLFTSCKELPSTSTHQVRGEGIKSYLYCETHLHGYSWAKPHRSEFLPKEFINGTRRTQVHSDFVSWIVLLCNTLHQLKFTTIFHCMLVTLHRNEIRQTGVTIFDTISPPFQSSPMGKIRVSKETKEFWLPNSKSWKGFC